MKLAICMILVGGARAFQLSGRMAQPLPSPAMTQPVHKYRSICFLSSDSDDNASDDTTIPDQLASQPQSDPSTQRSIDPLIANLTRMDEETINAKRTNLPIWGELVLDRSLFVLVPVLLFAILGIGTSVLVAVNAQDQIIAALDETSQQVMLKGASGSAVTEGCRGLCSSQEQDLESLRLYLNAFKK
jgi:hypothetical protein